MNKQRMQFKIRLKWFEGDLGWLISDDVDPAM